MPYLIALALASALGFGVAFGFWLHDYATIEEVRGSPTVEFVTTQQKTPEQKRPRRVVLRLPWPTYGLKVQRTHSATDFKLRPPFRLRWTFKAHHVLEFPPAVAYGRLYLAQQFGRFPDRRLPRRLPRLDAAASLLALPPQPARDDHGDGSADRQGHLAFPGGRVRDVAARDRQDALRRLLGSQALRDQHLHGQGALDLHSRSRDQQLAGLQ